MPLALIVNELLTNAVKHGVNGSGRVTVRIGLTREVLAFGSFAHRVIMLGTTGPGSGAAVLKLVDALGADRVFDPETIQILVDAFDEAWKTVQASSTPFASERSGENARQILAKSIIENATRGERDRQELAQSAILKLAQSNLKVRPPPPFQNP